MMELVKEYWEAVGVKVSLRAYALEALRARSKTSDHGLIGEASGVSDEWGLLGNPRTSFGYGDFGSWYYDWCTWDGPTEGGEKFQQEGDTITYQDVKEQWDRIMKWKYETLVGSKEYMELAEQFCDWWSENLVNIGIVGLIPKPIIFRNNLGNVPDPKRDLQTSAYRVVHQFHVDQWFFK